MLLNTDDRGLHLGESLKLTMQMLSCGRGALSGFQPLTPGDLDENFMGK